MLSEGLQQVLEARMGRRLQCMGHLADLACMKGMQHNTDLEIWLDYAKGESTRMLHKAGAAFVQGSQD